MIGFASCTASDYYCTVLYTADKLQHSKRQLEQRANFKPLIHGSQTTASICRQYCVVDVSHESSYVISHSSHGCVPPKMRMFVFKMMAGLTHLNSKGGSGFNSPLATPRIV